MMVVMEVMMIEVMMVVVMMMLQMVMIDVGLSGLLFHTGSSQQGRGRQQGRTRKVGQGGVGFHVEAC